VDGLATTYVSIRPDASGFRKETEAKIKKDLAGAGIKIQIRADTRAALADATKLRAQLEALSARAIHTNVDVNDKAAQAKLLAFQARLIAVGKRTADPNIDIEGIARAQADIAALDIQLDDIGHKKVKPEVKVDTKRSQLELNKVALLLAGLAPAVVPLGGAGVAAVGAFGASLTTAGIGGAAFAAAVIPAVKDANDALGQLKKDGPDALNSLTEPEKRAAVAIDQLKKQYRRFQTDLQPITLPIVTTGLDTANRLLPKLEPIVKGAAVGIQDLENSVAHGLESKRFQQFSDVVAHEAGPSIEAFGQLAEGAAKGVGNVVIELAPALPTINRFIAGLGTGIDQLTRSDGFSVVVQHIGTDVKLVGGFVKDLVVFVGQAAAALEPAGRDIITIADNALPALTTGIQTVGQVIAPVTGFLADHTDIVLALGAAYAAFKIGSFAINIALSGAAAAAANPELALLAITIGSVAAAYLAAKDGLTVTVDGINDGIAGLKTGADAVNLAVKDLAPNFGKSADEFDQFAMQAGVSSDQLEKLGKEAQLASLAAKAGLFDAPVFKQYQKDLGDVSDKIRQYQKDAANASNPTYQYQQALKDLTSSAADGQDKIQLLDQALQGFRDTVTGMLGSNAALGDSLATTFKDLKGVDLNRIFTGQVVGANEATRTFAGNLANLGSQLDANLVEFAKQGHSTKEVGARYQELRGQFIRTAESAGLTREQARRLVDEYLKIPPKINTKVDADTNNAKKKLDDVKKSKDGAKGSVKVNTEAIDALATKKRLDDIRAAEQNAKGSVKVNTSAPGAKSAADLLYGVTAKANGIPPSKKVEIIAEDNASRVIGGIAAKNGQVISTQYVDIQVRQRQADAAYGKAPGRATGGTVFGPGTGTSDSVPIWASRGEEVINAKQSAKHRPLLKAINAGVMGFASGGTVGYANGGTVDFTNLQRDLLRIISNALTGTSSIDRIGNAGSSLIGRVTSGLGDVVNRNAQLIKDSTKKLTQLEKDRTRDLERIAKERATATEKIRKADEVLADRKATPTQRRTANDNIREANTKLAQLAKERAHVVDTFTTQSDALLDTISGAKARKDLASGRESALVKAIRADITEIKEAARERDALTTRIQSAQANAAQVRSATSDFAGITSIGFSTAGQLNAGLQAKLASINSFTSDIIKLSAMGLNKDILQQLINEGPGNGGVQAAQLVVATRKQIQAINRSQSQINRAGGRLGTIANNAVLGGNAAKGFVDGLVAQRGRLEQEMDRLAARFSRGIKITISGGVAHRATGGPLAAGQWSVVGETQPELFRSGAGGRVYTPQQAGGLIDYNALAHAIARAIPARNAPLIGTVNQADNTDMQLAIRRVAFVAQEVGLA
jgi:trimeric autotransporter adhesin